MRPLQHEIDNVYICGDGKRFLDESEAKEYQRKLEVKERKKALRQEQKEITDKLKKLTQKLNDNKD
jgi:hypothetical protein